MYKYYLLLFFTFLTLRVCAQDFYVSTSSGEVDKVTMSPTGCTSTKLSSCRGNIMSIAIYNQTFYFNNINGLYKADITPDGLVNCTFLTNIPSDAIFSPSSLTVDANGVLYFASMFRLYKYDPKANQTTFLGTMPYSSAGDLVFYNGDLYMATLVGILKVDLADPSKSVMAISITNKTIFGLVNVLQNGQIKIFATAINGGATDLYQLDFANKQLGQQSCSLPYMVYDAGSAQESNSSVKIQLNTVNIHQDCSNPDKGMVEAITGSHTDPYTFTLSGSGGNTTNATGIFNGVAAGSYQLTITSQTDQKTVAVQVQAYSLQKPDYTYTVSNQVCDTAGIVKFSSADTSKTYKIEFGTDVFPLNHTFTGLATGTYQFNIFNTDGCTVDSKSVVISRDKCTIKYTGTDVQKECTELNKGSITVATGPHSDTYTYTLDNPGTTNSTGVFNMLAPGNYTITITSPEDSKQVNVTIPDYSLAAPSVSVTKINPVCDLQGQIKLQVGSNPKLYQIGFNSITYPSDYVFKNLSEGQYHFSIFTTDGCLVNTADVQLIADACSPVSFPNTFSPNNDGINDIFRPDPQSKATNYRLSIYNRYGALLFSTTELHTGWDGTFKGGQVPIGTYYWVAIFTNQDNKQETQKGYVALIR